jgi:hypothetical protein
MLLTALGAAADAQVGESSGAGTLPGGEGEAARSRRAKFVFVLTLRRRQSSYRRYANLNNI